MTRPSVDFLINKLLSCGECVVPELVSSGIDLNAVGSQGRTILMVAASEGLREIVEELAKRGVSVSAVGANGMTALHEASSNGHVRVVLRLLELGAVVDAETEDGVTPFMCAAAWGNVEVARVLLSHGADSQHTDHTGASAADIASEKGEELFVKFLDSLRNPKL